MSFIRAAALHLLLAMTLVSAVASAAAQDNEDAVRKDRYGDPLPPGALARLGTSRLRHTHGEVSDAAFSADGKVLASFGWDNYLRIWDTADGRELQNKHLKSVSALLTPAVALSPDAKIVAVSSFRNIALYDVGKAEPRLLPEREDSVSGLTFAPDSKLLAVYGSARPVSLINAETGEEVRKLVGHEKAVLSAAFSSDGKTLVTSSEDLTCRIWNVADGKQQKQMEAGKQRALLLALSPDGKWLAWWNENGKIEVRDRASGKENTTFDAVNGNALFSLDWRQSALRFTPAGTLQALYGSRYFSQWHPDKGLKSRTFEPVSGKTAFGRIAPDGKIAALWDWDHGTTLHLFDLETGKEKEVATGHLKPVYTVLAQPGGKLIASVSSDRSVRLWDPATSRELRRWQPESTWHPACFTTDGKALAFGDYDGKHFLRVCDLETGKHVCRVETGDAHLLALGGDGKLLLAADFTRIEVWDFENGKRLRELEGVPETKLPPLKLSEHAPWLTYTVGGLVVSPDGKRASAVFTRRGDESSVYLWDTATGKRLPGWPGDKHFRGPIAFSPDGKVLAAVQRGEKDSAGDLVFWDLATEKIVQRFPIADVACCSVAFSRDGRRLALGGYYKSIVQIYEVATAKEVARFRPHQGPAALAFSDDGRTLITGSDDATVLVWDLQSKALQSEK